MSEIKEVKKIKRSKSFLFVFPMLSESINHFLDPETMALRTKGFPIEFPQCYIRDVDRPEHIDHIFLLYRFNSSKEFALFEAELSNHPFFVESYDPTPHHVMFVFGVPDDFKLEYDLFKSERPKIYRRFSEQYKQQIMKFLDPIMDKSAIESILYSHVYKEGKRVKLDSHEKRFKELEDKIGSHVPRDIDNFSIPIIEEETFNKINFT